MEVEVLGKKYEVLEILPRKHSEHDLFVCKALAGYKECFQRIDIGRELKEKKMSQGVMWTYEEIEVIKEAIKNKISTKDISKFIELNRHTELAIRNKVMFIKQKMSFHGEIEIESKPRFNIKF